MWEAVSAPVGNAGVRESWKRRTGYLESATQPSRRIIRDNVLFIGAIQRRETLVLVF